MAKSENKTDEELVGLAIKDSHNFTLLIDRYEAKLSRYIYRLCGCRKEDIEDLLQEIFIKIYRNLNDFDQSLKFSSWAYRIAHNEVRRSKSRPIDTELIPDLDHSDKKSDDFIRTIDAGLDKNKISEILGMMDIRYKEVLVLRYFEELEYAEISDIIKRPMGTVATLLNRAKKQCRQKAKELDIKF